MNFETSNFSASYKKRTPSVTRFNLNILVFALTTVYREAFSKHIVRNFWDLPKTQDLIVTNFVEGDVEVVRGITTSDLKTNEFVDVFNMLENKVLN